MAKKFLTGLTLANLSTDPVSGSEGELYYNTTSDKIRIYINGVWTDLSTSVSASSITGNLNNIDSVSYPDYIVFDTTPENTSASVGTLSWDSGEGGLGLQLNANTQVTLGQEIIILANNGEATTLNKGEVVRLSGASGQRPKVTRAYNTSDLGSAVTIGIVAESIASGAEGFVVTQGIVKNINTNGFNEGDILYLSASAGVLTTVKPQAPNHYVFVGVVTKKNASSGRIYVKPQNGYELDEIHDVRIVSEQNGDIIIWNSASSLWMNEPLQTYLTSASVSAFNAASANTVTQINALTTTDIEEGTNLYFTDARSLNTASIALVHSNHSGITASYNSASGLIVLSSSNSGKVVSYGFTSPSGVGTAQDIYYEINSGSTALLGIWTYNESTSEWIEFNNPYDDYTILSEQNWQWLLDESGAYGWYWLEDPEIQIYGSGLVDYNELYLPNLVADIIYLTKANASATYLTNSSASSIYLTQSSASNTYLAKTGGTISGNLIITGDLTVSGSTTYLNTTELNVEDNLITLNYGYSGSPTLNAGIEVERGDSTNVALRWNEAADYWEFTNDGIEWFELGSGGGALLFQPEQPDITNLDPGTVWIDSDSDIGSGLDIQTFQRWSKLLTASATTISGTDDNSLSLLYTPGYEQVFINGTMISRGTDYTATTGTTVVLTEAALSGDLIEIVYFAPFAISDTYTKANADALFLTKSSASTTYAKKIRRWRKTYSASTQLIQGLDDSSNTLLYAPGYELVHINGVLLATNEYTTTSASVITLNEAVLSTEVVDIIINE